MRYLSALVLGLSLVLMPAFFGCDRTVSHTESTKEDSNGTVKHDESTVKQDQNGNTVKTETKTEDKP